MMVHRPVRRGLRDGLEAAPAELKARVERARREAQRWLSLIIRPEDGAESF